jgi:hypothetical protein
MSRDDAYLLDMLRFVREVLEFARGVTEELEGLVPPEEKS